VVSAPWQGRAKELPYIGFAVKTLPARDGGTAAPVLGSRSTGPFKAKRKSAT
jgi:hypothetical protein